MKRRAIKSLGRIGFYLLVALIVFYAVFPFYWAIVTSLKTGSGLFTADLMPTSPTFENYIALFREQPFAANILNSAIVAVVTTAISLETQKGDLSLALALGLVLIGLVVAVNAAASGLRGYAARAYGAA